MPNISFDIFYNNDIVNITASRSGAAPRAKPDWKVRQAPKLGPRQVPTPATAFGNRALRNAESSNRQQNQKRLQAGREIEELESEAGDDERALTAASSKKLTETPAAKKGGAGGVSKEGSSAASAANSTQQQKRDQEKKKTAPPKLGKQRQETPSAKNSAPPKGGKSSA